MYIISCIPGSMGFFGSDIAPPEVWMWIFSSAWKVVVMHLSSFISKAFNRVAHQKFPAVWAALVLRTHIYFGFLPNGHDSLVYLRNISRILWGACLIAWPNVTCLLQVARKKLLRWWGKRTRKNKKGFPWRHRCACAPMMCTGSIGSSCRMVARVLTTYPHPRKGQALRVFKPLDAIYDFLKMAPNNPVLLAHGRRHDERWTIFILGTRE